MSLLHQGVPLRSGDLSHHEVHAYGVSERASKLVSLVPVPPTALQVFRPITHSATSSCQRRLTPAIKTSVFLDLISYNQSSPRIPVPPIRDDVLVMHQLHFLYSLAESQPTPASPGGSRTLGVNQTSVKLHCGLNSTFYFCIHGNHLLEDTACSSFTLSCIFPEAEEDIFAFKQRFNGALARP